MDTLDDWLIFNLLPPNPQQTRHQYLLGKYGVTFLVIGSSAWELPTGIAVYELGLEKYWPVVYGYGETVGDISNDRDAKRRGGRFSRYRMEYDHAVKRRVYEMAMAACEPGSAE